MLGGCSLDTRRKGRFLVDGHTGVCRYAHLTYITRPPALLSLRIASYAPDDALARPSRGSSLCVSHSRCCTFAQSASRSLGASVSSFAPARLLFFSFRWPPPPPQPLPPSPCLRPRAPARAPARGTPTFCARLFGIRAYDFPSECGPRFHIIAFREGDFHICNDGTHGTSKARNDASKSASSAQAKSPK